MSYMSCITYIVDMTVKTLMVFNININLKKMNSLDNNGKILQVNSLHIKATPNIFQKSKLSN